jgi:hypothetical protein
MLTIHNKHELTVEERNLSALFNSIGVAKILCSIVSLFNFLLWQFFLKKITLETSLLRIHSSNGQMASSDHCYFDWACLSVTQSSNR